VPLPPDSVPSALALTGEPVEEELGEASVGGAPVVVALEALGDQVVAMGTVEAVPTVDMARTATLLLGDPMETLGVVAVSLTAGMDKTVM